MPGSLGKMARGCSSIAMSRLRARKGQQRTFHRHAPFHPPSDRLVRNGTTLEHIVPENVRLSIAVVQRWSIADMKMEMRIVCVPGYAQQPEDLPGSDPVPHLDAQRARLQVGIEGIAPA